MPRASTDQSRAALQARLQARCPEIEETILARVYAVSQPTGAESSDYLQGFRAAVGAAVEFTLATIGRGEERSGPIPLPMLTQARNAARNGVGLEIVLRRYTAGYSAVHDFLTQESHRDLALPATELYRFQRELTALFDRLVTAVTAEYRREQQLPPPPAGAGRHTERVRRLLAGELVETTEIAYDFDAHHLGVIATGSGAQELLRELASRLDHRLLLVKGDERTIWAWLGARHSLDPAALCDLPSTSWPQQTSLVIGEPAQGLGGWRLTHRQAKVALSIALRRPQRLTRYGDIALLASILRDDDQVEFLTETYLAPLAAERDGGEVLRKTLRAYFAAARNVSSAAAALGVSRKTVNNRIFTIENHIGRPISTCAAELEIGLCLDQLTDPT